MKFFSYDICLELSKGFLIGVWADEFKIRFDFPDETIDFVDVTDCLVTSFKALDEWIFIIYYTFGKMDYFKIPELIHNLPPNLPRHHTLTVCHLFTIEVCHILNF